MVNYYIGHGIINLAGLANTILESISIFCHRHTIYHNARCGIYCNSNFNKMTQKEKDKQVSNFLANTVKQLPYFIENDIMDSFEVTFELNGKKYQLALIKDGMVDGMPFQLSLN